MYLLRGLGLGACRGLQVRLCSKSSRWNVLGAWSRWIWISSSGFPSSLVIGPHSRWPSSPSWFFQSLFLTRFLLELLFYRRGYLRVIPWELQVLLVASDDDRSLGRQDFDIVQNCVQNLSTVSEFLSKRITFKRISMAYLSFESTMKMIALDSSKNSYLTWLVSLLSMHAS